MPHKAKRLYYTIHEDALGFYVEVFDRAGQDVAFLPEGEGKRYPNKAVARSFAIDYVQNHEGEPQEIRS